jgi:hypothetical protein
VQVWEVLPVEAAELHEVLLLQQVAGEVQEVQVAEEAFVPLHTVVVEVEVEVQLIFLFVQMLLLIIISSP